uniref:NACHT domain-containing protein n=1 Tax=Candidatus Kentrum sp. MB TaxID=2138164 RepID=A0A451BBE7_9GAMM|nr:MAG: NACHT domain-containing protein [Candidatus Kentron sp. MB]VFK31703.1 MAG: NACHT domain-containing protein [Candidatus Kentron sp. MB]VFK75621.1 MAG: NACHT domain-containing protein [Candidatus Kentron sp. MB]
MDSISNLWSQFYNWLNGLDGAMAAAVGAILGGVILTLIVGLFKLVLIPVGKKTLAAIGDLLYPIASGAIILDRHIALPRYLRNVHQRLGHLRNPWLTEAQELKDIFIPLSATARSRGERRTEIKEVFRSTTSAVLVGDPGSGKSTALRAIAMDCAKGKLSSGSARLVPVFIELRRWAQSRASLMDHAITTLQENGFPRPRRLLNRLWKAGRLVFLLDALDEVDDSQDKQRILAGIRDLLSEEKGRKRPCPVFVTSRPTSYDGQLSDLAGETLHMADFTPAQIARFVRNWDFRPPKSHRKLVNVIMDRRPILEICRNPLMLTIVTSLYRDTDYQLPDSREDFYKICIDALLRRWDAARELESRNKFPPALKEAFLQDLAFRSLSQWTRTFSRSWLDEEARGFLSKRDRTDVAPDVFLDEIIRSGLLGTLETGEVFYAHKTFAEALTAAYLRNKPGVLVACWRDRPEAWLEVCSLYAADPRTAIADIGELMDHARGRDDWSGLLTIAGEAHTVAAEEQAWIEQTLLERPDLWDSLDQRAMAALPRMKREPRALLTAMVAKGSDQARQKAIYALGYSGKDWATELLLDSLTDDKLRETAIASLAALADGAVSILREVIASHGKDPVLMTACVQVAEAIGSRPALKAVAPLVWSDMESVNVAASRALLVALQRPELRNAFETGGFALPEFRAGPDDHASLSKWALPWLETPSNLVVSYYCKMIGNLAEQVRRERRPLAEIFAGIPTDFLIPIVITASTDGKLAAELAIRRDSMQLFRGKDKQQPDSQSQDSDRIGKVYEEIASRSPDKNMSLWARAKGEPKADVSVGTAGFFVYGGMSFLATIVPLVVAITTGQLSEWWLLAIVPLPVLGIGIWIGIGIGIWIKEKEDNIIEVLFVAVVGTPVVIGLSPGLLRHSFEPDEWQDWVLLLSYVPLLGFAVYSAILLPGYWFLFFLPVVIQPLFADIDMDEGGIVFWRRENPLLTLRHKLRQQSGRSG